MARSVAAIQALDSAPSVLKAEIERPFAERVIAPLGGRMVGLGRRLVRADTARKIQYRLNIAGNPPAWDVNRILGLKVLGAGIFTVLGFLYLLGRDWPFYKVVVATALVGLFGYVLPNILLYNAGQKREKLMRNGLPDAMDLLTISVEAGLGFDAAVSRVAKNGDGPLNQEFARLLQEMQLGVGRVEAMRAMAAAHVAPGAQVVLQRHGASRQPGHSDRARAAHPERRDAHQASPAGRGEGAAGSGAHHDPARALHPAVPLHHHPGPRRHQYVPHVQQSLTPR